MRKLLDYHHTKCTIHSRSRRGEPELKVHFLCRMIYSRTTRRRTSRHTDTDRGRKCRDRRRRFARTARVARTRLASRGTRRLMSVLGCTMSTWMLIIDAKIHTVDGGTSRLGRIRRVRRRRRRRRRPRGEGSRRRTWGWLTGETRTRTLGASRRRLGRSRDG